MDSSSRPGRALARLLRASARELLLAVLPLTVALGLAIWAVLHFVRPAAPKVVTISTGPDGSSFQRAAERYAKAFEEDRAALVARLDAIEQRADALKLPVAFAGQFYVLREHIGFVRRRLARAAADHPAA